MSIAAALVELKKSPALPDYVAGLQAFLEDEREHRTRFRRECEGKRAEFINGQIHVSPAANVRAKTAAVHIAALLHAHAKLHDQGHVYEGDYFVHCQRNDYLPDVCFFAAAKFATSTSVAILLPPPNLAVEILSSATGNHARTLKLDDYARYGIEEYWIVDAESPLVEQYVLANETGEYKMKTRLPEGACLTSTSIHNFTVPVKAFFDPTEYQRTFQGFLRSS